MGGELNVAATASLLSQNFNYVLMQGAILDIVCKSNTDSPLWL